MIFTFDKWDKFCRELKDRGMISVPLMDINEQKKRYIVLKHDIENTVPKAYRLAEIEYQYGHRGTYFIHAHLLNDKSNIKLLKKMQEMGHEISYHHDVMDSNKGNIDSAVKEFETNRNLFELLGFPMVTVCQHGNPVIERNGYSSNRDFFRNLSVQKRYPDISDVMVDFKEKHHTDYQYYSDAGRKFKMIYDPINNDRVNSEEKDVPYENLDELVEVLNINSKAIISTHPHRWSGSAFMYVMKNTLFKCIKWCAKILISIPVCRKLMSRYYYLAKNI